MKKSTTRVTVVVIILVVAVLGYYAYLVNRTRGNLAEKDEKNPVQQILSRDIENDYPPTPKEVIKYYNEIMKCFYNEECTEEEIEQLAMRARKLYDDELLANNEMESYLVQLKAEIADFQKRKCRITSYSVAASTDVVEYEVDGYSFARIRSGYNMMENKVNIPITEVYLLRKDENRHWKIYGWEPADKLNENKE